MVHLAARLAVLATIVSLAVDVAAVPAPRKAAHSVASTKAASGSKTSAKHSPAHKPKGGKSHAAEKRQFGTQQVLSSHGRYARNVARDDDKLIVNGDHDHIHISDHDHHRHHGHHGHHDHDKIILNGDHEHVHIKDRADSSVVVNDNHGESYVVSRSEQVRARGTVAMDKRTDDDAPSGTIDLMLRNDAGSPKKLGSLYMNTNKNPVELDASDHNSSTSYMVEDPSLEPSDDPNVKFVQLHFLVTDARKLAVVPWCATYNSSPDHPAPMTVIPCHNSSEPADPAQSQSFMYLIDSGSVSPMSATAPSNPEPEAGAAAAEEVDDMSASATNFKRDPATQNVTLVFTPSGPETLTQEDFAASEEDDHGMASTVTKTVTVTASASSSGTPAVAAAAADPTTTTSSASKVSSSSSASSSHVTSSASSSSASASASAAAAAFDALDVQVFKAGESSSSSSASTSASSSTVSASSSAINAEAVASQVANASESSSSTIASTTASSTSVSRMAARAEMTAVNTAPYNWTFKVKRDE